MVPKIEQNFVVGQYYKSVDDVRLALDSYNKAKSTDFTVVTNNRRSLVVKCKHGSKQKENTISKSTYKGVCCCACITFHKAQKSGDRTLKLTRANLSHNHLVRREWQNLETMNIKGEQKEMFLKLKKANAQLQQINNVLIEKKKQKGITPQRSRQLINYRNVGTTKAVNCDKISLDALEEFLGNLLDDASDIEAARKKKLTDRDKYKIIMPVLSRIGRLITHQPTKQFLAYLHDLSMIESSIHIEQDSTAKKVLSSGEKPVVNGREGTPQASPNGGSSTSSSGEPSLSRRGSDIQVTMKRQTGVEVHHRRDTQSNDISTIDINNFQASDVSTIELNLRIPSFFSI